MKKSFILFCLLLVCAGTVSSEEGINFNYVLMIDYAPTNDYEGFTINSYLANLEGWTRFDNLEISTGLGFGTGFPYAIVTDAKASINYHFNDIFMLGFSAGYQLHYILWEQAVAFYSGDLEKDTYLSKTYDQKTISPYLEISLRLAGIFTYYVSYHINSGIGFGARTRFGFN